MHVASFLRETRCWFGVIRKLRKIIDLLIQVRYLVEVNIRLGIVFLLRWEETGWNSTKIWRKKNWIATYGIPNVLRHKLELQWMKSAYRIKLKQTDCSKWKIIFRSCTSSDRLGQKVRKVQLHSLFGVVKQNETKKI